MAYVYILNLYLAYSFSIAMTFYFMLICCMHICKICKCVSVHLYNDYSFRI